ncbi:hypothetical protein WOLCODRAFT_154493 [Wolfiporia cocos MD-104 SS10]|uniref:F-box domain-containing protein n=1 Tax=Wolfiporia cocos (strain MD-104) TaxID=742152 RepID=A0A2H3JRA0_WOLCO|nr:hypothetical protein WOLCODRAFT_154493 [Wolfiporia cocos MD-104 SS10]
MTPIDNDQPLMEIKSFTTSPIEPTGGSQRTLVLLDIPPEVMLQIITLLDIWDILALRKWNGVIAAKFITQRHILCVKAHAVELCTLPSGFQTPASLTASNPALHRGERRVRAHIISHTFSRTTYRGASISSPTILPSSDAHATKASVSFLAYDVLRGLFHYRVSLLLPSAVSPHDSAPPTLSVSLVASRYMAMPYDHSTLRSGRPPRSGLTPGGRAFVSACVLGPAGMRGVWVERRRGSVRRAVVGFRAAFQDLDKLDEGQLESAGPTGEMRREGGGDADTDRDTEGSEQNWWEDPELQVIDGSTLHEVNSYDLRNDITHCAFSEATTQIVLGTRNGRIQLLETTLPGAAEPVMPILDDEA